MAELKTKVTSGSVSAFLAQIPDPVKRSDCQELADLMAEVTGAEPELWGPSIVGFGRYHYRYPTGRMGEWFFAGFAPRKQNITVYLMGGVRPHVEKLSRLGKHKTGVGCLYFKSLADIDRRVLAGLVEVSVSDLKKLSAARKAAKEAKARGPGKPGVAAAAKPISPEPSAKGRKEKKVAPRKGGPVKKAAVRR